MHRNIERLSRRAARTILGITLIALALAAGSATADVWPSFADVPFVTTTAPCGPVSEAPFLHATRQRLFLTWFETPAAGSPSLQLAWNDGTGWSTPRTVTADPMLLVNGADVPHLLTLSDGTLVVSYGLRSGPGEASTIQIVTSRDDGATWSAPLTPHRDAARAEHGFVSLFPDPVDGFWATWLDGRHHTGEHGGHDATGHPPGGGATELRAARWRGGVFGPEVILDPRTCDCCPTAAARTLEGVAVAWRDRSDGGVRDISVVRYERGLWGQPFQVRRDDWKIDACPVNGPALAARDRLLAMAWFTDARETPEVFVALSDSSAFGLSRIVRLDDGNPLGRPAVEWLPDDAAVVVWVETVGGVNELLARRATLGGETSATRALVKPTGALVGFPRLALFNDRLWLAWTERINDQPRVTVGCLDPSKAEGN